MTTKIVATVMNGRLCYDGKFVCNVDHYMDAFPIIEEEAEKLGKKVFRRGFVTFYIVGEDSPYWARASKLIPLFN